MTSEDLDLPPETEGLDKSLLEDISLAPLAGRGTGAPLVVAAVRDVTELRHRARLAARLAAIVHASDAAILSTGPGGTIDSRNPAAERLFGYSAEEMIGRDLAVLVPDDVGRALDETYARLRAGERVA